MADPNSSRDEKAELMTEYLEHLKTKYGADVETINLALDQLLPQPAFYLPSPFGDIKPLDELPE